MIRTVSIRYQIWVCLMVIGGGQYLEESCFSYMFQVLARQRMLRPRLGGEYCDPGRHLCRPTLVRFALRILWDDVRWDQFRSGGLRYDREGGAILRLAWWCFNLSTTQQSTKLSGTWTGSDKLSMRISDASWQTDANNYYCYRMPKPENIWPRGVW